MKIDIQITGVKELQASFKDFSERRLNATVATALTRTAVQVRDKVKASMLGSFNAPTPYTLRQLRYVAANAKTMTAVVGFNIDAIQDVWGNAIRYVDFGPGSTPAGKYLDPEIKGGPRRNKRFEKALKTLQVLPAGWYAVPGQRAKIDAYGNQSVGEIRQILSWFNAAQLVAGSTQNMTAATRDKRRKGTKKTAGWEYFLSPVGGRRSFVRANGKQGTHSMQPGIYKRTAHALGSRVEPILIFVKAATYKKRFDFYGITRQESERLLPSEIEKAVAESLARLNRSTS